MKKFLIILIVLLFPVLTLFGIKSNTSAAETTQFIKVQTLSYSDGSVLQGFYISVNSQFLIEKGATQQEVVLFKKSIATSLDSYKNYLLAYYSSIYLSKPDENFIIGSGGGIEFTQTGEIDSEIIGFQIKFTSREAWNYYHPSSGEENQNPGYNENEFVSKVESSGKIMFSQNVTTDTTYGQYFVNMYLNAGNDINFSSNLEDIYSPKLIYEYAVSSSKIHSNADYSYLSQLGLYHHVWERDLQNYQTDNQMSIYYYQPNTQWWYLTIICIGVAIVGIGLIIFAIQKRGKKNI